MRLSSTLLTALAIVTPIVSGAAVPAVEARSNSTLAARDSDEIIYLTNCHRTDYYTGNYGYSASYAPWYSNWRNSQGGQKPDSLSNEYRDWSNGGGTITFEGREQIFSYNNGPTLYIHIDGNGLNAGTGNYAGYIDRNFNGAWTRFNCYRDNDRSLFQYWDTNDANWRFLTCEDTLYYCHY